jgi:hypothetical protein
MVVAIGYGAELTVKQNTGHEYTDVFELETDTRGTLLDKLVEASYTAHNNLLNHINKLIASGLTVDNDRWHVSITYPTLVAEFEIRHSSSSVNEPLDIVRAITHYRHMEIEQARNAILFAHHNRNPQQQSHLSKNGTSLTHETDFNYFADLQSLKNEGYQGSDWDKDFTRAVIDGRWSQYLEEKAHIKSS